MSTSKLNPELHYGSLNPDEDLRLQFEAVSRFEPEEKKVVKALLEGLILKHEASRWSAVTEQ